MESLDERIRAFLAVNSGDGDGSGDGSGSGYGDSSGSGSGSGYGYCSGSGSGYGDGFGSGDGYGDGFGSGDGSGDGSGYGSGDGYSFGSGDGYGYGDGYGSWRAFAGRPVYYIDELPTLIDTVHTSYAKGAIIREDLTLQPCYISRVGDCFAHGDTLRQARADAQEKYDESRPLEDRIDAFVREHPDLDTPYGDLFRWHHTLTGSCEMGRKEWCRAHNLQPTDSITVRAFIDGTVNDYGGDAIRILAKAYNYDPQDK